jgi:hypothetical protein
MLDVIALQETWQVRYPNLYCIPGFQPIIIPIVLKGGGVELAFTLKKVSNVK